MDTTTHTQTTSQRRARRQHSPQFRAAVIQACQHPGVSVASVALAHGLNANMLRSWVRAQENTRSPMPLEASAFIPVALSRTAVVPSQPAANTAEIRIQIQRANTTVIVNWPLQGVAGCAQWLREWLA